MSKFAVISPTHIPDKKEVADNISENKINLLLENASKQRWFNEAHKEFLISICRKILSLSSHIYLRVTNDGISCDTDIGNPKKFLAVQCGKNTFAFWFFSLKHKERICPECPGLEYKGLRRIEKSKNILSVDDLRKYMELIEKCYILSVGQLGENYVSANKILPHRVNKFIAGKTKDKGDSEIQPLIKREQLFYLAKEDALGWTADEEGFPEGKQSFKRHLVRERNPKLKKLVKEKMLKERGKLQCEICTFVFQEQYGKVGAGYIEIHHTVPVSEFKKEEVVKPSDITLVCSNCHSMLHRKRPWLEINELKRLLMPKKDKL